MPTITEQLFSRSGTHRRVIDLANDAPSAPARCRRVCGGHLSDGQ
jgi:hypothetical protein